MKRLCFYEVVVLVFVVFFAASMVPAATISEDFEGLSSSVLPSGWTLADNNGGGAGPVYANVTPGAYGASDTAAWIGPNNLVHVGETIPGGWFQTPAADVFSGSVAFSGSFDFSFDSTPSGHNDAVLLLGDLDARAFYWVVFCEISGSCEMWRTEDNSTRSQMAGSFATSDLIAETWYRTDFTWTPTAGNVGDFSLEVWDGTTKKGGFNTSLTMDNDVYFGFGSCNDIDRFDNISITPEPGALALLALDGLALIRRRKK